jgi:hypothetical protein
MSACDTCRRAGRDCPVWPQKTEECVEYRFDGCRAWRSPDQLQCGRCGLAWDVTDPGRPACLTPQQFGRKALAQLRAEVGDL